MCFDPDQFARVARQLFDVPVERTTMRRLRRLEFEVGRHALIALEQNPDTQSRWAAMAQEGKQVVQFKDGATNRYVAVAVDGKVKKY
jgi:hypothetical protein